MDHGVTRLRRTLPASSPPLKRFVKNPVEIGFGLAHAPTVFFGHDSTPLVFFWRELILKEMKFAFPKPAARDWMAVP